MPSIAWVAFACYIASTALILFSAFSTARSNILAANNVKSRLLAATSSDSATADELKNRSLDELATEAFQVIQNLRQSQDLIVDNASHILCALDEEGRILELNSNSQSSWIFHPSSLIGVSLCSLALESDRARMEKQFLLCRDSAGEIQFESQIKLPTGGFLDVQWTAEWSPTLKKFFCMGKDISLQKQVERLRAEFTAMVSHDLRAPVSALSFLLQGIYAGAYGELTERGQEQISICRSNVEQMLRLIDSLLDAEKIDAGELVVDPQAIPLVAVVETATNLLLPLAEKKNIKFIFEDSTENVIADFDRSVQILANLLSNALKFSPDNDEIIIKQNKSGAFMQIQVKDNGPGIPADKQSRIFERFKMLASEGKQMQGSGLGLYLAKSLVELQGGSIGVDSSVGKGAQFWFTLPHANFDQKK